MQGDPPEMLKVVKQTKKPCFVYKLLADGRLTQRQDIVEARFKYMMCEHQVDRRHGGRDVRQILRRVRHQQGVRNQVRRNVDQNTGTSTSA